MYKIGDSVRHALHGVGVVVAVLENMLTIYIDGGKMNVFIEDVETVYHV